MVKAKKHSVYCINCDWKLEDTHKFTDAWKCPNCEGPVVNYKKKGEHSHAKRKTS